MPVFEHVDYEGNIELLKNRYGCVCVPTTYELGKAEEYMNLLTEESSARAIFIE